MIRQFLPIKQVVQRHVCLVFIFVSSNKSVRQPKCCLLDKVIRLSVHPGFFQIHRNYPRNISLESRELDVTMPLVSHFSILKEHIGKRQRKQFDHKRHYKG